MLAENAVAQQLAAAGHGLHFYAKSSREAAERMEIDFLVVAPYPDAAMKLRVSPIEVKSGKRVAFASLDKFKAKFEKRVGIEYVIWDRPAKPGGNRRFVPLYMSHLL